MDFIAKIIVVVDGQFQNHEKEVLDIKEVNSDYILIYIVSYVSASSSKTIFFTL